MASLASLALKQTAENAMSSNAARVSLSSAKTNREGVRGVSAKKRQLRTLNLVANGAVRSRNSVAHAPATSVEKISFGGEAEKSSNPPSWSVVSEEISFGSFPRSPRDLELLVQSTGINAFVLLETEEGIKQVGLNWEDFRTRVNQQGAVAVRLSMKANDKKDQLTSLPEAVRAVAALVAMGYKVHVSCTNGIHRSPLVALAYLTLMKGKTLMDAWRLVTEANPLAKPNTDVLREVADRKLKEAFQKGVETDVSLSDAVAKATTTQATKLAFEEVNAYKAKSQAALQGESSSKDKLEFFTRQILSLKEKEEAARKRAALAEKEKETLSRKLNALTAARTPTTSSEATTATLPHTSSPTSPASPTLPLSEESLSQLRTLKSNQSAAKKEVTKAQASLQAIAEKLKVVESSISEAKASSASQDKLDFLNRQLDALKTKEAQAQKSVSLAEGNFNSISAQLAALGSSSPTTVPSAPIVVPVQKSVGLSEESKERLDFLSRKLEEQKKRHETDNKKADERIAVFSLQVSEMKLKLAAADILAAENEKKIGELSEQIEEYQRKEKAAAESTKVQADRLEFFSRHIQSLREKEEAARSAARSATDRARTLDRRVSELASKEASAAKQVQDLHSKLDALMQLNTEQGLELQESKAREEQLLQVLEDGTGVLTKALEADKTVKQLRQEVQYAMTRYEEERVRADLLAAELERELIAAGKKPKHYNDIEKVPSSDLEKQLLSQLSTTKQTMVASGTTMSIAVEQDSSGIVLRDIILGALGMAAVPFTLMSIFSDTQPNRMAEFVEMQEPSSKNEIVVQMLTPEEVLPPEPVVKPTSADDFCKQTLNGSRSARVERFCNSLAEIGIN